VFTLSHSATAEPLLNCPSHCSNVNARKTKHAALGETSAEAREQEGGRAGADQGIPLD